MAIVNILGTKVSLGKVGVLRSKFVVLYSTWGNESVPLMYIMVIKSVYIQ